MEWKLGDSLGISDRGTKAKTITSCDKAFVTNIGNVLSVRQQQSAQSERKSTPHYGDDH
ncbi:hypothetical protein FJQ98_25435 [Lysinibacillus agricola]|uniref:Uncharacterized protein n=1 Tax=Lysinibacillus agricola TaxID=2590012 RepID=A0ABX7AQZ5_9BACI|nr:MULTISPECIES: hypothetical protein [Lysinibacillus]QQP12375.1 hypothetical protein FJQ98_25435 [Lysinibacillus agricola]